MIRVFQQFVLVLGRVMICLIFLMSAVGKITNFKPTQDMMTEKGIDYAGPMLMGAIACELVGGFCVLLGLQARLGALLLIAFLIPATYWFHDFWTLPPEQVREMREQQIAFLKNVAIAGGLLFVVGFGPGAFSLDAWRQNRRREY